MLLGWLNPFWLPSCCLLLLLFLPLPFGPIPRSSAFVLFAFLFHFLMSCNFFFYLQALCVRTQTINGNKNNNGKKGETLTLRWCECVSEVWKTLLICKWRSFRVPSTSWPQCLPGLTSLSSCPGQGQVDVNCNYDCTCIRSTDGLKSAGIGDLNQISLQLINPLHVDGLHSNRALFAFER